MLAHADDTQRREGAQRLHRQDGREHGFDRAALHDRCRRRPTIEQTILDAISRPAERVVPWYEYRDDFLTEERIAAGHRFWMEHAATTRAASADRYGVAPEMLVGILGVETSFGRIARASIA